MLSLDGLSPKKVNTTSHFSDVENTPKVFASPIVKKSDTGENSEDIRNTGENQKSPQLTAEPNFTEKNTRLIKRPHPICKVFFTSIFLLYVIFVLFNFVQVYKTKSSFLKTSNLLSNNLSDLNSALKANDIEKSVSLLKETNNQSNKLKIALESYGQDLVLFSFISPNSKYIQKETLLNFGVNCLSLKDSFSDVNLEQALGSSTDGYIIDYGNTKHELSKGLTQAESKLDLIEKRYGNTNISEIKEYLPKIHQLKAGISDSKKLADNDLNWLFAGNGGQKNIIIIFQNNNELRGGSGGSFGSFGVAKFEDGKLLKIDFGTNIFKLDNEFSKNNKITPPEELVAYNNWTMKNAGIAVDGKEAFDKIRWFYEQETKQKVDGVISIDTTAFTKILETIGSINMPTYNKTITAQNFVKETQEEVQTGYFTRDGGLTENEPKKILGDMMPIVMDRIINLIKGGNVTVLAKSIQDSLQNKNILLNMDQESLQSKIDQQNFGGRVKNTVGDYLYVNNSNIGGGKTDQLIKENINLKVNINNAGEITNNLTIQRQHTGDGAFPDGLDQNFARVLIPKTSTIENFVPLVGNFQIWHDRGFKDGQPWYKTTESNKDVIDFWMSTEPQKTSSASILYSPNYTINPSGDFEYVINFQCQPGAKADDITLSIQYPDGFIPLNVTNYTQDNNFVLKFTADTDKEIKIKFKKVY